MRGTHLIRKFKLLVAWGCLVLLSACTQASPQPASLLTPTDTASSPTAAPAAGAVSASADTAQEPAVDYCLECHTDQQALTAAAVPDEARDKGQGRVGEIDPMDPWQKVFVDAANFPGSIHGLNGCISCHGGVQSPEMETAHQGVVRNPSKDAATTCGECHPNVVEHHKYSLHSNSTGFFNIIAQRTLPDSHPTVEQAVEENCSSCHATCGDCHVSRPNVVGGGFVDGHMFQRSPSMTSNCTVCHGSPLGDEFLGRNDGLSADVHFAQGQMECMDCHTTKEIHGFPANCSACHTGPVDSEVLPPDHRYDSIQSPRCESCHANISAGQDENIFHQYHGGKLSCQVCHSIEYTNCQGCHLGTDQQTGRSYYEIEEHFTTFLIGRNPMRNYERPYEFVPVRHVPVDRETFSIVGEDLLGNFDSQETWKYATPHNIQRRTPQTASCNACHGSLDFFLTSDKVAPEELEANRNVIVDTAPPAISTEMLDK